MSLLTQCPRCGFAYVRPRDEATEIITCHRCHCVFSAVAGRTTPAPPPVAALPLSAPIVVSSVPPPPMPTEFVIEDEPIHEVEHIEVLDAPPEETPAPRSSDAGPATASFELSPPETPAPRLDDVEVVEPPWFLSQQSSAAYFSCAVDELCVFDRALTTQEIGRLAGK